MAVSPPCMATRCGTRSPPDLKDCRELKEAFAGVIGSQVTPACLTVGDNSVWIYGQIATANYFDVLGVRPPPRPDVWTR